MLQTASSYTQIPNCKYDLTILSTVSPAGDGIIYEEDDSTGALLWKVDISDPARGKQVYEV